MHISVYLGDITTVPAEVVCTSTNPHLDLILGTGGVLREAGGDSIQQECRAIIQHEYEQTGHRYLPQGAAAVTGAGKLPFRAIIHCVAIDAFHVSTPETIASCVRSALGRAAELTPPAQSLAMPVFASGNGRFDFERSLAIMADELQRAGDAVPPLLIIFALSPERAATASTCLKKRFGQALVPTESRTGR